MKIIEKSTPHMVRLDVSLGDGVTDEPQSVLLGLNEQEWKFAQGMDSRLSAEYAAGGHIGPFNVRIGVIA